MTQQATLFGAGEALPPRPHPWKKGDRCVTADGKAARVLHVYARDRGLAIDVGADVIAGVNELRLVHFTEVTPAPTPALEVAQ